MLNFPTLKNKKTSEISLTSVIISRQYNIAKNKQKNKSKDVLIVAEYLKKNTLKTFKLVQHY